MRNKRTNSMPSTTVNRVSNKQNQFNMYKFIEMKTHGKAHSEQQIDEFISLMLKEEIPDYQISAWLMASHLKGLTAKETSFLTKRMLHSGKVYDFNRPDVIDKHSTGGIGDKTSFILAPVAAACGVKVPMVAGRALGFTGGTVDKIESIPNIDTNISIAKFKKLLIKNNIVLIGQTEDIAPADKKLYSLRDVTSTIESIELITASIMSKKLAEGTAGLVFDVKFGNGAFMKTPEEAIKLAKSLNNVAKHFGKKVVSLITDMNQPLGHQIGNSLEIIECCDVLKGKGPQDITEISLTLAAHMIVMAGKSKNLSSARKLIQEKINNGEALEKFRIMIQSLGGNTDFIENYDLLPVAKHRTQIIAPRSGRINSFKCDEIGFLVIKLGGGRVQASDQIDHSVGLTIKCKIGDQVKKGDVLGEIVHHKKQLKLANKISDDIFSKKIIEISNKKSSSNHENYKLILKTIK